MSRAGDETRGHFHCLLVTAVCDVVQVCLRQSRLGGVWKLHVVLYNLRGKYCTLYCTISQVRYCTF